MSPDQILVLLPERSGDLVVVPIDELVTRLAEVDVDTDPEVFMEDIFANAAIDTVNRIQRRPPPERPYVYVLDDSVIDRVRAYNASGDIGAYWARQP